MTRLAGELWNIRAASGAHGTESNRAQGLRGVVEN